MTHPAEIAARDTTEASRDYHRIARAIDYLRCSAGQPALAEVAAHVHLSEYHFQRLFTRWTGVSPKRFLQFLTLEHARSRLGASPTLLDLANDVGLSGPGRLHDLFVAVEAASPAEVRSGGAGVEIEYGMYDSPFGACLIATSPRGVCSLHFVDGEAAARESLRADWPRAALRRNSQVADALGERIFRRLAEPPAQPLALLVKGTNFQIKVWRALLELPFGAVTTYGRIARYIGRPLAARAVGSAIGANPIAYLIPCHRVLREGGECCGYRWGASRKIAMLGWEAARSSRTQKPINAHRFR